jgi:murein DD-endopeptidase MepM/ murein hydrolase activator NlpD
VGPLIDRGFDVDTRVGRNSLMPARRYTVVLTDRNTGTVRQFTISAKPVLAVACAALTLPVLVGVGAAWKGKNDISALFASNKALEAENASYRQATEALVGQISAIQSAVSDLGAKSVLDPPLAQAMDKLPALVKARAMGGSTATATTSPKNQEAYVRALTAFTGPDDTFGLLRSMLEGLETRLLSVRGFVERRNALAAATPSIWPANGWLTSTMGFRQDPLNGGADFHAGLDIAAEKGRPVYATAEGTVKSAEYQNSYGNLIVLDHGFGIETRYGHLSEFSVSKGQQVKRGDVIGRIGATGRATGTHLHYEILAGGRILNPLQLLTQQRPRAQ